MSVRARWAVIAACFAMCLGATPSAASTSPAPLEGLVEVGSGEMRWFGMEIYDARLLNSGAPFIGVNDAAPLALEITYRKNISGERLVRTTEREWERLAEELALPEPARVKNWLAEMNQIWPDVAPGDFIIALVASDGQTHFHGTKGHLGTVSDPEFGPAFLSIWLHPKTRAADLRAQLLGESR